MGPAAGPRPAEPCQTGGGHGAPPGVERGPPHATSHWTLRLQASREGQSHASWEERSSGPHPLDAGSTQPPVTTKAKRPGGKSSTAQMDPSDSTPQVIVADAEFSGFSHDHVCTHSLNYSSLRAPSFIRFVRKALSSRNTSLDTAPQCTQHLEIAGHSASLPKAPTHKDPTLVLADLREPPSLASDPLLHNRAPGRSHSTAGLGGRTRGATLGRPPKAPRPRQLLGGQSQDLEEGKEPGQPPSLWGSAPEAPPHPVGAGGPGSLCRGGSGNHVESRFQVSQDHFTGGDGRGRQACSLVTSQCLCSRPGPLPFPKLVQSGHPCLTGNGTKS